MHSCTCFPGNDSRFRTHGTRAFDAHLRNLYIQLNAKFCSPKPALLKRFRVLFGSLNGLSVSFLVSTRCRFLTFTD